LVYQQLAEMRQIIAQQAIAIDNLAEAQRRMAASLPQSGSVQSRLEERA
jgi:hypothetical protein